MAILPDKLAEEIEQFIRREFRVMPDDQGFSRDVHLYDAGYVDSTGVVELLAFLESTFHVKLEDEHIFSEAFTTITGISRVVALCLNGEPVHCYEAEESQRAGKPIDEGNAASVRIVEG